MLLSLLQHVQHHSLSVSALFCLARPHIDRNLSSNLSNCRCYLTKALYGSITGPGKSVLGYQCALCQTSCLLRTVHSILNWLSDGASMFCHNWSIHINTLLISMDHYLGSELVLGIGPKIENRLSERFSIQLSICVLYRNLWRTCVLYRFWCNSDKR